MPRLLLPVIFVAVLSGCGDDGDGGGVPAEKGPDWDGNASSFSETFEWRLVDGTRRLCALTDGTPFTGELVRTERDGQRFEERYCSGLRHGLCTSFTPEGARTVAPYENGVPHGDVVMYTRRGVERSRIRYEHGRLARLVPSPDANGSLPRD